MESYTTICFKMLQILNSNPSGKMYLFKPSLIHLQCAVILFILPLDNKIECTSDLCLEQTGLRMSNQKCPTVYEPVSI